VALQRTYGNRHVQRLLAGSPRDEQSVRRQSERAWASENPAGMVTARSSSHVILWNFDVGRGDLKAEHVAELDRFAALARMWQQLTDATLAIDGHASRSGADAENEAIARDRARAAAQYLQNRGISRRRMTVSQHGESRPWVPNVTSAAMARNRRVELRAVGLPEAKPAPRPKLPPPPGRPPRPSPAQTRLGQLLPSGSFEIEADIVEGRIPLGDWIVYPKLHMKFKFLLNTERSGTVELALTKDGLEAGAKAKVAEWAELKGTATPEGLEVGFEFGKIPLQPELLFDIRNPHKPLIFKVKPDPYRLGDRELAPGLVFAVEVEPEGEFRVGPSPQLLAKIAARTGLQLGAAKATTAVVGIETGSLAAAGGVAVGAVVLSLAWIGFVAHETVAAGERGLALAEKINVRWGYAWRIAGEAFGDYGYSEAFESVRRHRAGYASAYDGWMAAEAAIANAGDQADALLDELRRNHPNEVNEFKESILWRVGGHSDEDIPLPATLQELAR
jgi:outer membrane protein OmpA-like peptidoglycan-associated protein